MAYALLGCIGIAALAVYLLVVFREVPGAVAERLGELEGLPRDLGQWVVDETSPEGRSASERGLQRELRTWRDHGSGWFGRDRLVLQVRYRDRGTGAIQSADPDREIRRRRIKS
jgi:hypothetical protein